MSFEGSVQVLPLCIDEPEKERRDERSAQKCDHRSEDPERVGFLQVCEVKGEIW